MGPEKKFETRVKAWLDSLKNVWHFKVHGTAATGAGIPDIIACVNGVFVALEIKSDKGRVSEIQKATLRRMDRAGALKFIVCPSNFAKIKLLIEELNAMDWEDVPFDTEEIYSYSDNNLEEWGVELYV